MIIKGERVTASRAAAPLLRHLLHGEENDRVTLVQGTEQDARAAFADARVADKKFAVRHFIISPESETTRAEAMMVLGLLAKDFAFDPATAIVFEHDKPRALPNAFGTHWHCLVPEIIDAATGRVMDSRYSYLRHEKVARIAEHRLKHQFVRSNHEKACLAALESDGHLDVAADLRAFIENDPGEAHREAFSRDVHQMGKRRGVDVPAARAAVRAAWETTTGWADFTSALAADGFRLSTGHRDDTLIVETEDGVFVGAVHRLARIRKLDLRNRKERNHERATETEPRTRDAGTDAHRHSQDPVGTINSRELNQRRTPAQGSCRPVAVITSDDNAGFSDESGGLASKAGRIGTLHSGGCSATLRLALNRNHSAFRQLFERAQQLARPPQARVKAKLHQLENRLKAKLQELISPALEMPALDNARLRIEKARNHKEKLSVRLEQEKKRRERYLLHRPTGAIAHISGDKIKWSKGLELIDTRLVDLETQWNTAWEEKKSLEGLVINLENELQRKKRRLYDAPDQQRKILICRREITRIGFALTILDKNPAIALGGLTMLLVVAAGTAIINELFVRQFGSEPFLKFH